jgi:hypothetical protein
MMCAISRFIAIVEKHPVGGGDLASDEAPKCDPASRTDAVPASPSCACVIERVEIAVEVAITGVLPFELDTMTDDHAGARRGRLRPASKEDVQRRISTASRP